MARNFVFFLVCIVFIGEDNRAWGQVEFQTPPALASLDDTVTIRADSQTRTGNTFQLQGHVDIQFRLMRLQADQASYNESSGEVSAQGGVVFKDPQADLKASEVHYNLKTNRGWFADAEGFVQANPKPGRVRLATATPFYIRARRVERVNGETYIVFGAWVTSCAPGELGWSFSASRANIKPGRRVTLRHPLVRLGALPVFYFPYLVASISPRPRRSGFLIPQVGTSSQKGVILGEGFYWAINRSADLTLGITNYSIRGLGANAAFRARPSEQSSVDVEYFRVNDKGSGPQRQLRAPGQSLRLAGESSDFYRGFRAVADVDYISSLAFRSTFTNNFSQAVQSEVRSVGFVSKSFGPYSFNGYLSRYQNFLSAELIPNNSVVIRKMPSFAFSGMESQIGKTPLYFAFDSSIEAVGRTEPGFATPKLLNRTDFFPWLTLRAPALGGFRLTPYFGMRATRYGSSRRADRSSLVRLLGDFSLDLRPPALQKVLGVKWAGNRFKHVMEPQIRYRLVRARDPYEISDIIRFDQLDTLSETNEIEYSLTHRLFFRRDAREGEDEPPQARELLSWRLTQKYFIDPTFGGVLRPGEFVVFEPTILLTGFAFATGRRLSPIVSVLKFSPFSNYDTEVRADFNPSGGGVLNAGITSNVRRGRYFLRLTNLFVNKSAVLATRVIPGMNTSGVESFHLLWGVFGFGDVHRRGLSGAFGSYFNLVSRMAHQSFGQVTYNFGCFAVDAVFRRFALGPLRRENEFRLTLSLANVGSFGNLRRDRRLY